MNLLRLLLRTSFKGVVLAVVAGALSGVSSVGLLVLVHTALGQGGNKAALAWCFAALCVCVLAAKVFSQASLIALSQRAVSALCLHLSRRILATPLRQLEEMGPHRLLATLTNDVPTIVLAYNALPNICISVVIVACVLGYLAWLSWQVSLAVLGFMMLGVASYRLSASRAQQYLKKAREEQDVLQEHFRSLLDGIKELKTHRQRRADFLRESLEKTVRTLERHNTVGMTLFMASISWGRLLFFVLLGFVVFLLPAIRDIDAATLNGYALAILFVISPMENVMALFPIMSRTRVAARKVDALGLALAPEELEPAPDPLPIPTGWRSLDLVGVTHAYHREREGGFTLGPVDLSLRPGEVVYLVGGNGSGKTTLAKVLSGLYYPETGEMRIDGQAVSKEDLGGIGGMLHPNCCLERYRQLFSVVHADCHLFGSLLGLKVADLHEQAQAYLAELHLDQLVRVEDGVLSTTELSRGQRKRLSLLVAYLEDRPVYVFDEWAADQDPLFKSVFYTKLLPGLKARGKAVLVITHDERYFSLADRLLHLEDGKLTQPKA
jgi:putative ATP-binding cassette transporter